MDHGRPEIGRLSRFTVGDFRQQPGIFIMPGIGCENTVYIGPDPNFIRLQTGPQYRGGHIGAVTADGGGFPVLSAPQKAGDQGDGSSLQQRFELLAHQGLSSV